MAISNPQNIAKFDHLNRSDSKIYPIETEDSAFTTELDGLAIQRGGGDRLAVYLKVDPMFCSITTKHHTISIEYLDSGHGEWFLEYIPKETSKQSRHPWVSTERIRLENSQKKCNTELRLEQAKLVGAINGADLRIIVVDDHLDQFKIFSMAMTAPAIESELRGPFVYPSKNTGLSFPNVEEPLASIIIPIFNNIDYTMECLRAICEFTPLDNLEVIVVDNGSSDASSESLQKVPNLKLIKNKNNLGFAKACNQGAEKASGKYLVFLNNDTIPQPGWIGALLDRAERIPLAGVIGSRLIFPQTSEIQSAGVSFGRYQLPEEAFQGLAYDDPRVSVDQEVDAVSGACMLIRRSLFMDANGFDERFLNGFEDIDLCLQLSSSGHKNLICAQSNVLHYQSATEGRFEAEKDRVNVALFRKKWHDYLTNSSVTDQQKPLELIELPTVFYADNDNIDHQTGTRRHGKIYCNRNDHAPGHCFYGPYLRVAQPFVASVEFDLNIQNISDEAVDLVSLDIYDSVSDEALGELTVRKEDIVDASNSKHLVFTCQPSQILEFRVFWHGNCDLVVEQLTLNQSTDDS